LGFSFLRHDEFATFECRNQGCTTTWIEKPGWFDHPAACDGFRGVVPREVTVTVPADFSGQITLDPCGKGIPTEIALSAKGTAATAACPGTGETVSLTVIKGGTSYRISSDDVTIELRVMVCR
jgi:hypothetical protein